MENGKTLVESRAELQRGIENVEVACGIPTLMQGYNLEDVASGIDEMMIRQPLGVVAAITPFNFPAMIPLWFLPYAIACGNTFILKPSERVPLTTLKLFELLHETGLPKGVVNLVVGGKARGRRAAAPSGRPGDQLRRIDAGREVHLRGGLCARQARAVPGRREEPRRRHARRRPGDDGEDRQRQRVRMRGAAVPRGLDGHHRRRGVEDVSRGVDRSRIGHSGRATASTKASQMGPVITSASSSRILGLIDKGIADGGKAAARRTGRGDRRREARQFPEADRHQRDRSRQRSDDDRNLRAGALAAAKQTISTRRSTSSRAIRTATPRRSSRRAAPPRASSATKRRPATSA